MCGAWAEGNTEVDGGQAEEEQSVTLRVFYAIKSVCVEEECALESVTRRDERKRL